MKHVMSITGVYGQCMLCVSGIIFSVAAFGDVRLAALFGDNSVLQRDMVVPVWGTAGPDDKVEVSFRGQTVSVRADNTGRWQVALEPMGASSKPAALTARSGSHMASAANVVVGDVWLCSGQSNMEMPVRDASDATSEMAAAKYPDIREFHVPLDTSGTPKNELRGAWVPCSPGTVDQFSATAYYFGRELHRRLKIPVGLINSSRGATQIESWMSEDSLRNDPAFAQVFERWKKRVALIPARMQAYEESLQRWKTAALNQGASGKRSKPDKPDATELRWRPAGLYNAMIYPLTPAAIRGVIWYQGETNSVRHAEYAHLFKTMITQWRAAFRQPELPFCFVQLAGTTRRHDPTGEEFAYLREAQRAVLQLPNTGMVVTIDISDNNIHPKNKQDVGVRLARVAFAKAYGVPEEYSGPLLLDARREGATVRTRFSHAEGMFFPEMPASGFEIAGADMDFVTADARIEGGTIVVSSSVSKPSAVRYAWGNTPKATLFNGSKLPASPFLYIINNKED